MKAATGGSLIGLALLASACSDRPTTFTAPVFESAFSVAAGDAKTEVVPLAGRFEVPERDTPAIGTAIFHLTDDGTGLDYALRVANIHNVVQAHIHIGAAGANGPVGVFLFGPVDPAGGPVHGVIAEGTITADDFIGPLAGLTLADLVAEIEAGNTYVNVHTDDGVDPTNTGPGDFPGGEVRGQIR
jgi:hypothetical protein